MKWFILVNVSCMDVVIEKLTFECAHIHTHHRYLCGHGHATPMCTHRRHRPTDTRELQTYTQTHTHRDTDTPQNTHREITHTHSSDMYTQTTNTAHTHIGTQTKEIHTHHRHA